MYSHSPTTPGWFFCQTLNFLEWGKECTASPTVHPVSFAQGRSRGSEPLWALHEPVQRSFRWGWFGLRNLPLPWLLVGHDQRPCVVRPAQRPHFQGHSSVFKVCYTSALQQLMYLPSSRSDFDSQARNFKFLSWWKGDTFKEALMLMVLKGEKNHLLEIKASSLPSSPVLTSFDHLSIFSLSLQDDPGRFYLYTWKLSSLSQNTLLFAFINQW